MFKYLPHQSGAHGEVLDSQKLINCIYNQQRMGSQGSPHQSIPLYVSAILV